MIKCISNDEKITCLSNTVKEMIIAEFSDRLKHAVMTPEEVIEENDSYDRLVNSIIKDDTGKNTLKSFDIYDANGYQFMILILENYVKTTPTPVSTDKIVFLTVDNIIKAYNTDTSSKIPASAVEYILDELNPITNITYEIFSRVENNENTNNIFTVNVLLTYRDGNTKPEAYMIDISTSEITLSTFMNKVIAIDHWTKPDESHEDEHMA